MSTFYTYIYRDQGTPIYVGKGKNNRSHSHLKRTTNKHFWNRLQRMKTEGIEPSIEVIEAIDEDHAKFLEVCLISIFGRQDLKTGTLLNHTDGGDGRTTWSEEQKAEHSARITGQKRSEATKALMSKSAVERCKRQPMIGNRGGGRKKGSTLSEEHKVKLAAAARAAHARRK